MRYVFATDGSASSLKAARFLLQHIRLGREDEIFVIYVFPLPADPDCFGGILSFPTQPDDERVVQVARAILENTLEVLADTEAHVSKVILMGNPAKEIVEFAMNLGVDLIVAGTRGHSADRQLYLGSVSNALTHRARCSVLVVR